MRKKSYLGVYQSKVKRRRITVRVLTPNTFRSPVKRLSTPPKLKRKDVCTALGNTPKRVHSDECAENDLELDISPVKIDESFTTSLDNKGKEPAVSLTGRDQIAKHQSWACILERAGLKEEFSLFFELIETNKYPLDNIALILFLETVKFYSLSNTSKMTYSDASKRFWKAGCKLFHAKFLYFMGGPKNIGDVLDGSQRGQCDPRKSRINFAVPSTTVLSNFEVNDIDLPKRIPPGMIPSVIESIKLVDKNCKYMLCADAKKVTMGIDKLGGDVDMFGFEDGETLNSMKERLNEELQSYNTLLLDVKDNLLLSTGDGCEITIHRLKESCKAMGFRIKNARELRKRQKFGLNKFLTLGGEKWRDSKYSYAISGLQTSLYQIKEYIKAALKIVRDLCSCISNIQGSFPGISQSDEVDFSFQRNLLRLKEGNDVEVLDSRFVKQRTEVWFERRKDAPVTGSGIHDAVGFRGLKVQKNYMHRDDRENTTPSDELKRKLEHGTVNEVNAIATITGIVIPTYFPDCYFVEEGFYTEKGKERNALLIVSPDGSLRKKSNIEENFTEAGPVEAAIEIKCPFPNEDSLPVHYSLPQYYVCQCLAEMQVLKTHQLLYLSFSPESSTVLLVRFDQQLWNDIWSLIVSIFDREHFVVSKADREMAKSLKSRLKLFTVENVTLLAEIPSLKAVDSGLSQTCENSPFLTCWPKSLPVEQCKDITPDLIATIENCKSSTETCYNLLRRKASEVMVWVLTNIDRDSKLEIPCSIPVAYGLKDYKLTSKAMRKATDFVINTCLQNGINIYSFAADGQWIQLMTRDSDGNPMTILQLQKDVWSKVQSMPKRSLAVSISALNKVTDESGVVDLTRINVVRGNGSLVITSNENAFKTIVTTFDKKAWTSKKSKVSDKVRDGESTSNRESLDNKVGQRDKVNELRKDASEVRDEILMEDSLHLFVDSHNLTTPELGNSQSNTLLDSSEHSNESLEIDSIISDEILTGVLNSLQENSVTEKKWSTLTVENMLSTLTVTTEREKLTHNELNVVCQFLMQRSPDFPVFRRSWRKSRKQEYLQSVINQKIVETVKKKSCATVKKRNPPSLSKLCSKVIQSKKLPKEVLNRAYAGYIYTDSVKKWHENMDFKHDRKIHGYENDIEFWYSYPQKFLLNNCLIAKSIDCSHNLTHLRVRSCTTGIFDVTPAAWIAAAKSNETRLSFALVEDLVDKQSVPNARTNFSEEVENWMRTNGYLKAAGITKLVRNWYDASDMPGISAYDRAGHLIAMRKRLLQDLDFSLFPPFSRYINKIPVVTFEGLMIDIDTKLQLYGHLGPYNIRSVGSLAAETTVGILQELNPSNSSSIKARDVPALVRSVVELMSCKLNRNRGFHMRTAKVSGVYPVHAGENPGSTPAEQIVDPRSCSIILRNHNFDNPERKKVKRKIRFGFVSGPAAPARGAQPVRQWHKKDESKILPSKRLGIDFDVNFL